MSWIKTSTFSTIVYVTNHGFLISSSMSSTKTSTFSTIVYVSVWGNFLVVPFCLGYEGAMGNLLIFLEYSRLSQLNSFTCWLGIVYNSLISARFIFLRSIVISSKIFLILESTLKSLCEKWLFKLFLSSIQWSALLLSLKLLKGLNEHVLFVGTLSNGRS